jgi:isopenicillin N synthase-like dioxygenase
MDTMIPIIDISSWTTPAVAASTSSVEDNSLRRDNVVAAVEKACREIGFFAITGHGVDEIIITNALEASKNFFNLPSDVKLKHKTDDEKVYPYGYENNEKLQRGKEIENDQAGYQQHERHVEHSSVAVDSVADRKETFSIGPNNPASGMPSRRFLDTEETASFDFKSALEEYYATMEKLSLLLLRILALGLQLEQDWFDSRMDHHCSALRILNYYPIINQTNATVVTNCNNTGPMIRASAHTDYGALTILKSGGPGLQVRKDTIVSSISDNDEWIDVPVLENAFIINLGDLMPRWTNG